MPEESKIKDIYEKSTEAVKFTEDELNQVKKIQQGYLNIQQSFGQVKMAILRLEQQEIELEDSLKTLQDEERKFLDGVTDKYGQGTLNPETGVFTKNKSE